MKERLTLKHEEHDDTRDLELAAEFGRVVMGGMGVEAFTTSTMEVADEREPFGSDLVVARPDADASNDVTALKPDKPSEEYSWVGIFSTDWH
jgi:hypothetical protein